MSHNLSVEQKSILKLFEERNTRFLIPDYQRPYAWDTEECLTLWEDITSFAFPEDDFNQDDEYFLGPIVIFKNDQGKLEVIDGQQRLITILLILRAFYEVMKNYDNDDWCREVRKSIGKCIWETNEQGEPYNALLKLETEVATDDDRKILIKILREGITDNNSSKYSKNYKLFQAQINDFINDNINLPEFHKKFTSLPFRLLNNCILLPIEAGNQNTALRIFSTLNDRGKSLSDSDIFKVQLYKAFSADGKKDWFVERWKELEALCEKIFTSLTHNITPMDELFNRYMHYERATQNIKSETKPGLRAFYSRENYKLLRIDYELVFSNLRMLADFWYSVYIQDEDRFSERVLKRLFVLKYAPNAAWTLITSVYFIHNSDSQGILEEEKFYNFLGKITAFVWASTIVKKAAMHNLLGPIYKEMINIVSNQEVTFANNKFDMNELTDALRRYKFSGKTKITRSMLAWWMMSFREQTLWEITPKLETEHIHKMDRNVTLESYNSLGNQTLLEEKVRSSLSSTQDFSVKRSYYSGIASIRKPGTQIFEIQEISRKSSFNSNDIKQRNKKILDSFIAFIEQNNLTK